MLYNTNRQRGNGFFVSEDNSHLLGLRNLNRFLSADRTVAFLLEEIVGLKNNVRWTEEEISFLLKNYHKMFLKDMLAISLFKTKSFGALNNKCWRLGLKRSQKGKHNHNWQGGRKQDHKKYIRLLRRHDCPYAGKDGRLREHVYVWWKHYGDKDPILYGEVIHHINGDGRDNRVENLKKMKRWQHARLPKNKKETNCGKQLISCGCLSEN